LANAVNKWLVMRLAEIKTLGVIKTNFRIN